jgi:high-affinity nickel-transport protein
MPSEIVSTSGLLLMLVLGLRHGLDPDHIACIDGLTSRPMQRGHRHGAWVGTLFAIGHGLLVTVIAVVPLTQAAVSRPRSLVKTSILRLSQLNGSMSARV